VRLPVKDKDLDTAFEESVVLVSKHLDPFPADVLLKLYAYYKIATRDRELPQGSNPLINAFKTNALFQAKGLSQQEAKQKYIETANNYFIYRNDRGMNA
jgi:acyl-CoA-binding protein